MFTIEHEFDCTVVTLMDEGDGFLQEDVVINGFEDCITIQQFDPKTNGMQKVTMSITQMKDLAAAISLLRLTRYFGADYNQLVGLFLFFPIQNILPLDAQNSSPIQKPQAT